MNAHEYKPGDSVARSEVPCIACARSERRRCTWCDSTGFFMPTAAERIVYKLLVANDRSAEIRGSSSEMHGQYWVKDRGTWLFAQQRDRGEYFINYRLTMAIKGMSAEEMVDLVRTVGWLECRERDTARAKQKAAQE